MRQKLHPLDVTWLAVQLRGHKTSLLMFLQHRFSLLLELREGCFPACPLPYSYGRLV